MIITIHGREKEEILADLESKDHGFAAKLPEALVRFNIPLPHLRLGLGLQCGAYSAVRLGWGYSAVGYGLTVPSRPSIPCRGIYP